MKKIITLISILLASVIVLSACSSSKEEKSVETKAYMKDLKKALQSRWDFVDGDVNASITKAVNKELDVLEQYDSLDFEDEELEALAQGYNESLRTQKKHANDTDIYSDSSNYQKAVRDRTAKIVTFVEEYDLEVDSKYSDTLEELLNMGKSSIQYAQESNKIAEAKNQLNQIFDNLQWSSNIENEYDESATWTTTFTNTTSVNIVNVEYVVSFYDEEGVKLDSDSTGYLTSVSKGEKSQIKVDSYNVPKEAKSVRLAVSEKEYSLFDVKD